jgi:hypothetical protein
MRCLIFATLFLTACGQPDIIVSAPAPPAEWLDCTRAPDRPNLAPLEVLTGPNGEAVYLKRNTDKRDLAIAGYVIDLRAAYFDCSNKLAKVKQYVEESE